MVKRSRILSAIYNNPTNPSKSLKESIRLYNEKLLPLGKEVKITYKPNGDNAYTYIASPGKYRTTIGGVLLQRLQSYLLHLIPQKR